MAPQVEISIPNTTTSDGPKSYTIYNISLRLLLRSFAVQKRYSDFVALHAGLSDVVGVPPPVKLPAKTWFASTVSKPELAEERRRQLEQYLQTINSTDDSRWRTTTVWRAFLNLPKSFANKSHQKTPALHSVLTGPAGAGTAISDAVVWLDFHRELKSVLHDARINLTNRDQASTPQQQHEVSATAKACLVKSGGMITALEEGLINIQKAGNDGWGSQRLGDGELRRRKDLIATAKNDKDGLENLLNAMATKSKLDSAVASIPQKEDLIASSKPRKGRVLGKETDETRELDNQGVLQLQKQKMAEQDQDVDDLRKIIQRQKELSVQINQELLVQNELLKMVDEDVDRVQGKVDVAKKRIGRIS